MSRLIDRIRSFFRRRKLQRMGVDPDQQLSRQQMRHIRRRLEKREEKQYFVR